jgi:hypothetical protein
MQRISLAKLGGAAARAVAGLFQRWEQARQDDEFPVEVQLELDAFAVALRAHSAELPIVYFSEWIDMWSMGDLIPALGNEKAITILGRRYEACCHHPNISVKATTIGGEPPQETIWLMHRLEEAKDAWAELVSEWVVVILREPLGPLVEDHEREAALLQCPNWLTLEPRVLDSA